MHGAEWYEPLHCKLRRIQHNLKWHQLTRVILHCFFQPVTPKQRVPKVANCCFFMGQILPFYGVKQLSQLKKVMYGLSLFSTPLL
jgi:hypothetical protein